MGISICAYTLARYYQSIYKYDRPAGTINLKGRPSVRPFARNAKMIYAPSDIWIARILSNCSLADFRRLDGSKIIRDITINRGSRRGSKSEAKIFNDTCCVRIFATEACNLSLRAHYARITLSIGDYTSAFAFAFAIEVFNHIDCYWLMFTFAFASFRNVSSLSWEWYCTLNVLRVYIICIFLHYTQVRKL